MLDDDEYFFKIFNGILILFKYSLKFLELEFIHN